MINLSFEQSDRLAAKPAPLVMYSEDRVTFSGRELVASHKALVTAAVKSGNSGRLAIPCSVPARATV